MTDAAVDVEVDLDAAPPLPDDHEPFAHIVGQYDLEAAMIRGGLVRALCGHEFNPKLFNPAGLPMCERCAAILAARK
ncbi:MAG: DUF3039 domain-containing protein [Acidimicrobiales bacterium]